MTYLLQSAEEKFLAFIGCTRSTTCKYIVFILPQNICQHIAVEDLLQLFAPFAVSNIPSIRYQQFFDIFFTEICCLQCLQITVIRLKHIFVGRRTKTLIPTSDLLLKPETQKPEIVKQKLTDRRNQSKQLYDKHAREMQPLVIGDTVRVRDRGRWKPVKIVDVPKLR